jgi:phenylpyruvate tautomerase PptA (4-oxalocrotonate tautomerase family)
MPTYHCTSLAGLLDSEKKSRIAAEITRIHHKVTGAAPFFAQVIFAEVKPGDLYMGGKPLAGDQLFVHGHIRAGRSAVDRTKIVSEIVVALGAATSLQQRSIWVYVSEIPPRQMAEYGHVLPEPGDEEAWLQGLPADDRSFLLALGKQS